VKPEASTLLWGYITEIIMVRYDFQGKVVLVTGSSRGMGAVMLERFAASGAVCVVNYFADAEGINRRDAEATAERCRAAGAMVHVIDADVRDYDSVERMMREVAERCGGLDILVNNAGVLRDRSIKKMTPADWQAVLQTNLDGVFYCSKLAAEILHDGGRIINVASISAVAGFYGQANYAAAKAGVLALTKVLAKELARRRITVNAVAPGVVQTPMLGDIRPEMVEEYIRQIPLGRLGKPDDVAHAVLFLATEESEYITGQTLPITGGWF
jgi:3-oxoacyl-[acyl-carrier protein] reductase